MPDLFEEKQGAKGEGKIGRESSYMPLEAL